MKSNIFIIFSKTNSTDARVPIYLTAVQTTGNSERERGGGGRRNSPMGKNIKKIFLFKIKNRVEVRNNSLIFIPANLLKYHFENF